MPFLDGTGPQRQGAMTGRGAGRCTGANAPGYDTAPGRGFWCGRGGGRFYGRGGGFGRGRGSWGGGWGRGFAFSTPAQVTPEQEVTNLKAQATQLQNALQEINDRLDELQE